MCLHDHDVSAVAPPAVTRRNALAGAAVLAGVSAAGVAAASAANAGPGAGAGVPDRSGRPPVPGPLVVEGAPCSTR